MAKKKAPAKKKPKKPAAGIGPRVRVRMYRQGLGDCFLITFDVGGNEKHMLIDCGTLGATTTGVKLEKVVADIKTTTNNHLDLLIATHEHLDHVSGFRSQMAVFKQMTIDHVWMAWTEDPKDDLAKKIVKYKNDLGVALKQASAALQSPSASAAAKKNGEAIDSILGFFDDDGAKPVGASKFSPTVDEAMDFIRKGTGVNALHKVPGEVIEESWLPGFRFFVLGPPKDETALYNLGEHGSSQLYSLANALRCAAVLFASGQPAAQAFAADGEEKNAFAASVPFDVRFRREAGTPETKKMFADYLEQDEWRQINEDWLNVASDLALQLDSATNNTSLVLAIERIADGKVLLFPADAQEGNWVSWHDEQAEVQGHRRQCGHRDSVRSAVTDRVLQSRSSLQSQRHREGQGAGDDGIAEGADGVHSCRSRGRAEAQSAGFVEDAGAAVVSPPDGKMQRSCRPIGHRVGSGSDLGRRRQDD